MRDKLSIEEDLIADSAEDLNSYAYTQLPKVTRRQKAHFINLKRL